MEEESGENGYHGFVVDECLVLGLRIVIGPDTQGLEDCAGFVAVPVSLGGVLDPLE